MIHFVFRPAHGAEDAAALIAVHDTCADVDKVDPISLLEYRPTLDWYTDELARTAPENWVIAEADGNVVGYGHSLWQWTEGDGTQVLLHLGCVMPEYRGRGIGTELLRRLEERCRTHPVGNATGREYGANASGTEDASRALLEANGYFIGYTVLEMEHDPATALPDLPLPSGYDLRRPEPDHYRAIWQCIGDAYDVSRPNARFHEIATEGSYQRYFFSDSADPELWLVAWQGSRIAGQVLCRIENGRGEVYEVSIGYAHRRRGLARALLTRGLRALYDRGIKVVRLYTVHENPTVAWQLYEQVGFRTVKTFPRWRKTVTE